MSFMSPLIPEIDSDEEELEKMISNLISNGYNNPQLIGKGQYGKIFRISDNEIIKIITNKDAFKHELNIVQYIKKKCENSCPNCPEFLCYVSKSQENNNYRYIVYEDAGIDLRNYLKNKKLTEDEFNNIKNQLENAIRKLHNEIGIIHRDLKPDNITIKDNVIKLIDFGMAIKIESIGTINKNIEGKKITINNYNQHFPKNPFDLWQVQAKTYYDNDKSLFGSINEDNIAIKNIIAEIEKQKYLKKKKKQKVKLH